MAATVKWVYPQNFKYDGIVTPRMRRIVLQVFDYATDTAETDTQILNISELLTHNGDIPTRTVVDYIEYDVTDCTVKLEWDRAPKEVIAAVSGSGRLDWTTSGGNVDSGEKGDGTGDILLTTELSVDTASYTVTIGLRLKG